MADGWRGWFRRTPQAVDITLSAVERLDGDELLEVVGEASYQGALRDICGSTRQEEVRCEVEAVLVREPSNPYDSNAIRVDIEGSTVGYLSRGDAADYGPLLDGLHADGKAGVCGGMIAGRGPGSETPNLGVFLKMREP